MIAHASRLLLAWLVGAAATWVLASVAHTQTILAGLGALGVAIDPADRLRTTLTDLMGLWRYGVVLALALGLGLVLVRLGSRRAWSAPRGAVLAALAGAAGVAAALLAMRFAFSFTPIASARAPVGFAAQCLAGAVGGLAFHRCLGPGAPGAAKRRRIG